MKNSNLFSPFTIPLILASSTLFLSCATRSGNWNQRAQSLSKERNQLILGNLEPMEQLIQFENDFNLSIYQTPQWDITLNSTLVDDKDVKLEMFQENQEIEDLLRRPGQTIAWFHHPLNADANVPYFGYQKSNGPVINGFFSASRSVFFKAGDMKNGSWYSIKLPTDHIRESVREERKAYNQEELEETSIINQYVRSIRRKPFAEKPLGSNLLYLQDSAIVYKTDSDERVINGYFIRDLRPLSSTGKFYIPAFSVEPAGQAVYEKCAMENPNAVSRFRNWEDFWLEYFAKSIGRAKAHQLFEFGLHMWTPNAQNWLIELNTDFCPNGNIVVRDIVDSRPVHSFAKAIGSIQFVNTWRQLGRKTYEDEADTGSEFWLYDANEVSEKLIEAKVSIEKKTDAFTGKWALLRPLRALFSTIWKSPRWEFNANWVGSHIDAYFETILSELDKRRDNSAWNDITKNRSKIVKLHSEMRALLPYYLEYEREHLMNRIEKAKNQSRGDK